MMMKTSFLTTSSSFVLLGGITVGLAFIGSCIPFTSQKYYIITVSIAASLQTGEVITLIIRRVWINASSMFAGPLGLVGDVLVVIMEVLLAWGIYIFQTKVDFVYSFLILL